MSDMGKELICSFSSVVRSMNFAEMWEVARGIFSLLNSLANLLVGRLKLNLMLTEKTHKHRKYKPSNHTQPLCCHRKLDEVYCIVWCEVGFGLSVATHKPRSPGEIARLSIGGNAQTPH